MEKNPKKFKARIIHLKDGKPEKIFLDPNPNAHIGKTDWRYRIIVNRKKFDENLDNNSRLALIYHELGHSRLSLPWILSERLILSLLFLFSILFFMSSLSFVAYLIINFNIINLISFGFMIFLSIIFSITFTLFCWLREIISDLYASKKVGKNAVIKVIEEQYKKSKNNFFMSHILHPPWKRRIKLIEMLDK